MSDEKLPNDVLYEVRVAAELICGDGGGRLDWATDPQETENDFIEEEIAEFQRTVERRTAAAAEFGEGFEAPNYLMDKLTELSDRIRNLEEYRDRLITFTRSYAVDPESMRAIASATGLSHTTIMRIANEHAVRRVAFSARGVAASMLTRINPQQDPDLYARLSKIAVEARKASQE